MAHDLIGFFAGGAVTFVLIMARGAVRLRSERNKARAVADRDMAALLFEEASDVRKDLRHRVEVLEERLEHEKRECDERIAGLSKQIDEHTGLNLKLKLDLAEALHRITHLEDRLTEAGLSSNGG